MHPRYSISLKRDTCPSLTPVTLPDRGVFSVHFNRQEGKRLGHWLSKAQAQCLLKQPDRSTTEGIRDTAILTLMVYTGVRTVEVERANLADLRTEGGRLVLYVTGKGHDEADELVVIASTQAQSALYDWLAKRGNQPGALLTSLSDRSRGKRLTTSAFRHLIKAYMTVADLRGNKTTHSLRHTAITKVISKSGNIQMARSVARHRSIETTMIYFHELDRLENPGEAFIEYGE